MSYKFFQKIPDNRVKCVKLLSVFYYITESKDYIIANIQMA
jgi:hypothetical protein